MRGFNSWANSPVLFALCAFALGLVCVFALVFIRRAWREAESVGITKTDLKQMVGQSVVSALLPSLSVILFLIMLAPMVGRIFAWLRLSVLGSGSYEYMAAEMVVNAMGYKSLMDPGVTLAAFITVMWAMSLGIASGPICNVFLFKPYYERLQRATLKKSGFGQFVGNCLMMAMMTVMLVPRAMDYKNPLSMLTILFVGIVVVIFDKLGEKEKFTFLKDFSFPLSLLSGVIFAVVLGNTVFAG